MKLVPRTRMLVPSRVNVSDPAYSFTQAVTDADASRLEAVIAAADEMRQTLECEWTDGLNAGTCNGRQKMCTTCIKARDYDRAKRKAIGEGQP